MSLDFKDLDKYQISHKSDPEKPLSEVQIRAIAKLSAAKGNIVDLDEKTQIELRDLRATYHGDPDLVGAAVIADFSIRAVSIHKTWSVFKDMRIKPDFDLGQIDPKDVRLGSIYKSLK
ncbi:hypothetical protein ACPV5U_20230 [Vibrio mediterranei]